MDQIQQYSIGIEANEDLSRNANHTCDPTRSHVYLTPPMSSLSASHSPCSITTDPHAMMHSEPCSNGKRAHETIETLSDESDEASSPKRRKQNEQQSGNRNLVPATSDPLPHALAAYPTVSFHCLQRAQKTIQDFAQTYLFIFHTNETVDDVANSQSQAAVSTHPSPSSLHLLFRMLPLLTFISGTIYQLDEENEERNAKRRSRKMTCISSNPSNVSNAPRSVADEEATTDDTTSLRSYSVLLSILRSEELLTPAIELELQKGRLYWQLERELCEKLERDEAPLIADVHAASICKSFDYRVLNLVAYEFRKMTPDPKALTALKYNELLVDLHDDLVDYEDDIQSNSFNLYRMYAKVYGAEAPMKVMERIRKLEAAFQKAFTLLPRSIQVKFRLREEEAMKEYGRFGHDGSRWTIPQPILNELNWTEACGSAERRNQDLQE